MMSCTQGWTRMKEKRVKGVETVEQEVRKTGKDEVKKDLKRMRNEKAVGPDDIQVKVCTFFGERAMELLTKPKKVKDAGSRCYFTRVEEAEQ